MDKSVLLLNNNYEILSFIKIKKAFKLIFKDKVDVLSTWANSKVCSATSSFEFPSILKLKYYIKKKFNQLVFSRRMVIKRDRCVCQYCGKLLQPNEATVDHVVPRSLGGTSCFTNCVTACYSCNNKKGKKTLEESNMVLLSKPSNPVNYIYHFTDRNNWHPEWDNFLKF